MKKVFIIILLFFITPMALAVEEVSYKIFSNEKGLFGLKDSKGNILIEPQYKKLISLQDSSFIVQKRGNFGLVDSKNNILVPIKYSHTERILGKYLKIGNGSKYALYDQFGKELLKMEYSKINLLFGEMFLTCKNYKYGVIDSEGHILLDNLFDDIYMPEKNTMRIQYQGDWYEIVQIKKGDFSLPADMKNIQTNQNYIVKEIIDHPATAAYYSAVTFTDYFLKLFSSISPAHEKTIDNLMLSQGADAVSIYFKLGWIPKYPFVFAKNYFTTVKNPNNGPLSGIKSSLRKRGEK